MRYWAVQHRQVQLSHVHVPSAQQLQSAAQSQVQLAAHLSQPLQQPPERFAGRVASAIALLAVWFKARTPPDLLIPAASSDGVEAQHAANGSADCAVATCPHAEAPSQHGQPVSQSDGQLAQSEQLSQHMAAEREAAGEMAENTRPTANNAVRDTNSKSFEDMIYFLRVTGFLWEARQIQGVAARVNTLAEKSPGGKRLNRFSRESNLPAAMHDPRGRWRMLAVPPHRRATHDGIGGNRDH